MAKRQSKATTEIPRDVTSAGVPWSKVPDFALADVEWMDGCAGASWKSGISCHLQARAGKSGISCHSPILKLSRPRKLRAASSRCDTRRRSGLSDARLRKKLPMRLGAL
jgi:hypothetical protein